MGVNLFADQAATQQMSVALSQGAAAEVQVLEDKGGVKKAEDRSPIQKVLEGRSGRENTKEILSNLLSKMASSGIKLNPENFVLKLQNRGKDEYDLLLQSQEDSADAVEVRSSDSPIEAVKHSKKNNDSGAGAGRGGEEGADTGKMEAAVKEYSGAYAQYVVSGSGELKKKIDQLENQIRSKGIGEKELLSLKQSVATSVRTAVAAQIKEGLLKRMLSDSKSLDWVVHSREINNLLFNVENNPRLGRFNFGGHRGNLQGAVNEEAEKARGEIREFVAEGLERGMVAKHLGEGAAEKEIRQLIKLGEKFGFDFGQFIASWEEKKVGLGFQAVPYAGPNLAAGAQTSGGGGGSKTGYEFNQDDEKEILVNQLRALYMQRAIRGDMRAILETSFKVRKLKNELIKLEIRFGDFEKIEKEGRALAKVKTAEMLKEALYERATLYELAGPAHKLIGRKIKGIMKNLERLGIELPASEFNALRDEANRRMFDIAKQELEQVTAVNRAKPSPGLDKKEKLLTKLLKRLKEESNIEAEISFENPNFKESA